MELNADTFLRLPGRVRTAICAVALTALCPGITPQARPLVDAPALPDPVQKTPLEIDAEAKRVTVRLVGERLDLEVDWSRRLPGGGLGLRASAPETTLLGTVRGAAVYGELRRGSAHWLISTDRDGVRLQPLPRSGVHYNHCATEAPAASPPRARTKNAAVRSDATIDDTTVVDLLIVYNAAFRQRYPGGLLPARLEHLVFIANQAMANSALPVRFRLVGHERFNYRNDNSNRAFLEDLAQALAGFGVRPSLAGLGALRDSLGADIVIGIRPHDIELRGSCGIAYFPDDNPSLGVNVVSDGSSSWSVCLDDVLTHELGHNLAAAHQQGFGGGSPDSRGAALVRPGQLTTVMASFGTGRPDRFRGLPLFSNPRVDCGGLPCGDEVTDNAAVIIDNVAQVAAYRNARDLFEAPGPAGREASDADGDGVADWDDHFPFDPQERDDADIDGIGDFADAFPFDPAEQADTDDDGIGNNRDADDDGDDVPDDDDDFPLDIAETADTDGDGVGDNADHFPGDPGEFLDTDGDGLGDHADPDDDDDGLDEIDPERWDLLVVNAGDSRILRFDAQTGAPRGVEVPASDSLLTFQTALAWRETDQTLIYSGDSALRRVRVLDRSLPGIWLPAYAENDETALGSGFPTGVATLDDGLKIVVTRLNDTDLGVFRGQEHARPDPFLDWSLPTDEAPGDIAAVDGTAWILGRASRSLYRADALGTRYVVGPDAPWLSDPRRLAVTADQRLLVSDARREVVVAIDAGDGAYLGDLADLRALGYGPPDGLAVTSDGDLLVAAPEDDAVLAFDVHTGAFLGERVPAGVGGLSTPRALTLAPALLDRFGADPRRVIKPNPGLWGNTATDGRGFDIEIFGDRLSALWYTYDDDGLPSWLLAAGDLDGFVFEAPLLRFNGCLLCDPAIPASEEIGRLRLEFHSEREADMSFDLKSGASGGEPLRWLVFSKRPTATDYTGVWGPDGANEGISVATQGETTVAIAYLYDPGSGAPRWLISDPATVSSPLDFSMNASFGENLCPGCSGPTAYEFETAGTMRLELDPDSSAAAGVWSLDVTLPSTGADRTRFFDGREILRLSEPPTRPR